MRVHCLDKTFDGCQRALGDYDLQTSAHEQTKSIFETINIVLSNNSPFTQIKMNLMRFKSSQTTVTTFTFPPAAFTHATDISSFRLESIRAALLFLMCVPVHSFILSYRIYGIFKAVFINLLECDYSQ